MKANTRKTFKEEAKNLHNVQSRVVLAGLKPQTTIEEKGINWNADDLSMAIRDIFDMSEKCMINFIMLGELGKAIYEKREGINLPFIEIGMMESENTPEIKSLFKVWNFKETDYGYIYYFTPPIKWDIHIPVHIKVFKTRNKFFQHPDYGFYGVDNLLIPNPFEGYWKARGVLK